MSEAKDDHATKSSAQAGPSDEDRSSSAEGATEHGVATTEAPVNRGEQRTAPVVPGLTFDVPDHYGDAGALDALSSVAAPLLAGGTLALVGVIVQQPSALRWPGLALLLLLVAAILLVMAVQCGVWARHHATRPDEIAVWWAHDASRVAMAADS